MEEKHKVFLLFCLWCVLCLFAIAELSPQSYRILDQELTRLETIWQDSQADKLNWLSQVQRLKAEAGQLKADSQSLNSQLLAQRLQTEALRKSFEKSEKDRLNEIAVLQTENMRLSLENERLKKQRDVMGIILLFLAVSGFVYGFFKVRKLLGFKL